MGTKKNHRKCDIKAKTISGKKFSFQKLSLSKYVILNLELELVLELKAFQQRKTNT